jgi:hypothetical protein
MTHHTPVVNLIREENVYGPFYRPVGRLAEAIAGLVGTHEIPESKLAYIQMLGFRIVLVEHRPALRVADYEKAKKLCRRSPEHVNDLA